MGVWISCKPSDHVCLVACYLLKNQMRWSLHDKDLASLDAIGFTSSIKTQMAITLTSTNKLHLCEWMSNEYLLVNNSVDSTYWLSKSRSSHIQYPLQALHTGLIDIDCTSHHLHSQFSQMQDTSKSSHWCQKHPTVVLLRVPITVDLQVCDDFGESLEAQVRYFLFWGGVSQPPILKCVNFGLIENPLNKKNTQKKSVIPYSSVSSAYPERPECPWHHMLRLPNPNSQCEVAFHALASTPVATATFRTVFLDSSLALTLMVWGAAPFVCGRFAGNFSPGSFRIKRWVYISLYVYLVQPSSGPVVDWGVAAINLWFLLELMRVPPKAWCLIEAPVIASITLLASGDG